MPQLTKDDKEYLYTFIKSVEQIKSIVEIEGKKYTIHPWDQDLYDAIELTSHWPVTQVTFDRIAHLQECLQENRKRGHHLPYEHIRNIEGCRLFVQSVLHKLYENDKKDTPHGFDYWIQKNNQLLLV